MRGMIQNKPDRKETFRTGEEEEKEDGEEEEERNSC